MTAYNLQLNTFSKSVKLCLETTAGAQVHSDTQVTAVETSWSSIPLGNAHEEEMLHSIKITLSISVRI